GARARAAPRVARRVERRGRGRPRGARGRARRARRRRRRPGLPRARGPRDVPRRRSGRSRAGRPHARRDRGRDAAHRQRRGRPRKGTVRRVSRVRTMMTGKIHRATVTEADLDYVGSVTVDAALLEAADILPGERVDIVDVTNGARLTTYTIAGGA